MNPLTNAIYLVNSDDNTVSVISGLTNNVIATIPVDRSPRGVGVLP
ncbi:hypothetical protein [Priestia megaterium]